MSKLKPQFGARMLRQVCISLLLLVMLPMLPAHACQPAQTTTECEIGFLIAAPDRGFMGNEEIRDHFDAFAKQHNASLLHVTDQRTKGNLQTALTHLQSQGAKKIVVLPLFYSENEASFQTLKSAFQEVPNLPIVWAKNFGRSYFAVEELSDRLRAVSLTQLTQRPQLIVIGTGASDQVQLKKVQADVQKIAEHAAAGLGYTQVQTIIWPEPRSAQETEMQKQAQAALRAAGDAVVAQVHLGKKLDSMMAFSNALKRLVPASAHFMDEPNLSSLVLTWMQREANRHLPLAANQVGVVIAAHGSDWHWNETMRNSVRSLEKTYQVEYAFSMADAPVIARAVQRLDQRGARAIVIVRIFGMQSSFQNEIEHLIGQDVEASGVVASHANHHGDHGHGGGGAPVTRLRSPAVLSSAGGLDDHPLFARALLDRAQSLSRDPKRETIILTAHGTGSDAANAQWIKQLETIANIMRMNGGNAFREIRVATWREDWPDKRAPWVDKVRGWVKEASRDGEVIVIPARTTGTGPEASLLSGLPVRIGSGFAPHPLFTQWVEQQITLALQQRTLAPKQAKAPAEHEHHH